MVAPANDLFADATELVFVDGVFTDSVDITDATTEVDEPLDNVAWADVFEHTVWYTYTPAGNETVHFDTTGSVYYETPGDEFPLDTVVTVYTGAAVDALTLVDQDPDPDTFTDWSVDLTGGETYMIQVGIWATTGTMLLELSVDTTPAGVEATGSAGRRRTGYATAVIDGAVSAPPANVEPYSMARAIALPAVTYTNGRPEPVDPDIVTEPRLRPRIVIGAADVTYLRDIETRCDDYELLEPFGFGSATIRLPQLNPGENLSEFAWLHKGAKVRIDLVDPATGTVQVPGHYRGIVTKIESAGPELSLQVDGDLAGRAALQYRPPALFERKRDIGEFMYDTVRSLHCPFTPRNGPVTGIEVSNRSNGAGQDKLGWLSWLCQMSQQDGTQYAVMPVEDGTRRLYELRAKDTTTVAGTIYMGAPGVTVNLSDDVAEQPTDIYATMVHPRTGQRILNGVYPGLQPAPAPEFPGTMSLGDTDADTTTGDGVTVLTAKLAGTGFLDPDDKGSVYTQAVADAVEELRDRAGLADGDTVNSNVWDALFDVGTTGFTLRGSQILPLVRLSATRHYNRTANGSISGVNPDWDPHRLEVHRNIDFGVIRRKGARRWAKRELARTNGVNLVGEITLETDLCAGDHEYGDPITVLQATSLKAGANVRLNGYMGSNPLFHVSYVRHSGTTVTLGVDTQARDALTIGEVVARNREARSNPSREWIRTHRRSTSAPDALVGWSEVGGQVYTKQLLDGDKWNVIPVVAGQEGTISELHLRLVNDEPKFVVAVFGFHVTRALLARKIGNPFNADPDTGESKWTNSDIQDWLHDEKLLLYAAGDDKQPCGYYPRKRTNDDGDITDAPITGKFFDEAGFSYRTFQNPVVYLAIYPDRNCVLPAQRVFKPQMDDGI